MSEQTQWPHGPWFTRLAIVVSLAGLCWFVKLQRDRMSLVQREDLNAFIRVTLPAVPGWSTYTVLETANGNLAVPSDAGTLHRGSIKPDRQRLKSFLESEVYGQAPWRVLQWPLLAFLVLSIELLRLGRKMDARNNGQRLIQGAPIISHWRWNLPSLFKRAQRGFYIETK